MKLDHVIFYISEEDGELTQLTNFLTLESAREYKDHNKSLFKGHGIRIAILKFIPVHI